MTGKCSESCSAQLKVCSVLSQIFSVCFRMLPAQQASWNVTVNGKALLAY